MVSLLLPLLAILIRTDYKAYRVASRLPRPFVWV